MAQLTEGGSAVCVLVNKGNGGYLSCASPPFQLVDTFAKNDGSGRQMWLLQDLPEGDFCTIKVYAGRGTDSCTYLTVPDKGRSAHLAILSDTYQQQTWYLDDISDDGSEIIIRLATTRAPGDGTILSRDPNASNGWGVKLVDRVQGPDQKWSVMRVPEADLPKDCGPYPPTHPVPAPVEASLVKQDLVTLQAIKERVHDQQVQLRGKYTTWKGPDGKEYLLHRKDDQRVLDLVVRINDLGAKLTAHARKAHGPQDRFVRRLSHIFETNVSHVGDLDPSVWAAGICWNGNENVAWIGMKFDPNDSWCWTIYYFMHELSHCLGSWSHGEQFYASFRWCLRSSANAGLWKYDELNMCWQWEPADTTYGSFCPYRDEDYKAIIDALNNPPLDLIKRYPNVFAPNALDQFLEQDEL